MLTSERVNGIKTGYWSPAKKDELVQKLGPIEHEGPQLVRATCDQICNKKVNVTECVRCPLTKLRGYIKDGDTYAK